MGGARFLFIFFIAVSLFAGISAWAGGRSWTVPERKARLANPFPATDQSIALGKEIYQHECLSCHGTLGKGDGPGAREFSEPVPDLSNPNMRTQSDGTLFWKTTVGRRPMPSYKNLLTDEQRWRVVQYMRTLVKTGESKTNE